MHPIRCTRLLKHRWHDACSVFCLAISHYSPCRDERDILRPKFAEVHKLCGATCGSLLRNSEGKSSISTLGYSVQSFQGRMLFRRWKLPPAIAGVYSVEEKKFFFFFFTVWILPELEQWLKSQDCLYMSEIVGKFLKGIKFSLFWLWQIW